MTITKIILYRYFFLFCVLFFGNCDQLRLVIEQARHGARTAIYSNYYNMTQNSDWPQNQTGELTKSGFRMHYLLGRQMRKEYIEDLNFLSPNYSSYQIYAQSTKVNRTIASAYAQLVGIYPLGTGPSLNDTQIENAVPPIEVEDLKDIEKELGDDAIKYKLQPVPVHGNEGEEDFLLSPFDYTKVVQDNILKALHSDIADQMNEKYNKTLFPNITKLYNKEQSFVNITTAFALFDNYEVAHYECLKLNPALSSEFAKELDELAVEYATKIWYGNKESVKQVNILLFQTIKQLMQTTYSNDVTNTVPEDERLKFVLYLSHDSDMIGTFMAFGIKMSTYIRYTANLIYELWRKDKPQNCTDPATSTDQYYVVFKWNGEVFPIHGSNTTSMTDFFDILDCGFVDCESDKPILSVGAIVGIVIAVAVVIAIIIIIIVVCYKKHKSRKSSRPLLKEEETKEDQLNLTELDASAS